MDASISASSDRAAEDVPVAACSVPETGENMSCTTAIVNDISSTSRTTSSVIELSVQQAAAGDTSVLSVSVSAGRDSDAHPVSIPEHTSEAASTSRCTVALSSALGVAFANGAEVSASAVHAASPAPRVEESAGSVEPAAKSEVSVASSKCEGKKTVAVANVSAVEIPEGTEAPLSLLAEAQITAIGIPAGLLSETDANLSTETADSVSVPATARLYPATATPETAASCVSTPPAADDEHVAQGTVNSAAFDAADSSSSGVAASPVSMSMPSPASGAELFVPADASVAASAPPLDQVHVLARLLVNLPLDAEHVHAQKILLESLVGCRTRTRPKSC